ncbi:MAG TPA: hypothetical protein VLF66_11630, partial [Thermoanaerobaculia bacterium]|nr:hypothetical protein [Thermoanaerobaculia bacterium]
DAAWRSRDVPERFAAALPEHLAPEGRALVLLSSHGDGASLLAGLAQPGLAVSVAAERDFGGELLRLHAVRRRAPAAAPAHPPAGLREVAAR